MSAEITISQELMNKGHWLHVHIPFALQRLTVACVQNKGGTEIKKVRLHEGHNMIDVSQVNESVINLKIDTDFETIYREIKLRD